MTPISLNKREEMFVRALCGYSHGHVGQDTLRLKLEGLGMGEDEFKQVKKRLLYSGAIGIVYGNITLEDKSLMGLMERAEGGAEIKGSDKEKG
jgi:hypothetical protein